MAMLTAGEIVRRLYVDLVRRRSRVRVVPAAEVRLVERPIFLVGAPRSGTTLVRYIVDSHSRICCPPESNFIGPLAGLLSDELSRNGLDAMGFDEDHVVQELRRLCIHFFGNYAASCQKPRWADKSTTYVDHLDFIGRLFPEAQFVMIYRHGLDQAHSLTRGGSQLPAPLRPYHCRGEDFRLAAARFWREKAGKMFKFEVRYPDQCVRLVYEALCERPQEELERVFAFLDEPWEPALLDFQGFEHDQGPEHGRTIVTSGFQASHGHYKAWPRALVGACLQIAGPALAEIGYRPPERGPK
jgi:protein-tyrosine sulfotransferase